MEGNFQIDTSGITWHDFTNGTTMTEAKYASDNIFTRDNPYLTFTGKLWGAFCGHLGENETSKYQYNNKNTNRGMTNWVYMHKIITCWYPSYYTWITHNNSKSKCWVPPIHATQHFDFWIFNCWVESCKILLIPWEILNNQHVLNHLSLVPHICIW